MTAFLVAVIIVLTLSIVALIVRQLLIAHHDDEFPLRDDTQAWADFMSACERQWRNRP